MNTFKTAFLMTAMMLFVLFVGQTLGGKTGLVIALIFGIFSNVFAYWFSDKIILATSGARPVSESELPVVWRIVNRLAQSVGIPAPKVYFMDTDMPNAFATGRSPKHAAVAVTRGLIRALNEREIEGVLAHELSHVLHRDILISTIVSVMAGTIYTLVNFAYYASLFGGFSRDDDEGGNILVSLVLLIVAPIVATIIQLAISRSREYAADAGAAKLTADPLGLASALKKISAFSRGYKLSPTRAHMYIVNPLSGGGISKLFSTHPPIEERVAILEKMAQIK